MNNFYRNSITCLSVCMITILLSLNVLAQENYQPGYIITQSNDSITGLLDYRNWVYNPDHILFKGDHLSDYETYTALEIKEFGVDGEIYKGAIVEITTSPIQDDRLRHDYETLKIIDTTFLQVIFGGEKSLLYHKYPNGRENFYIVVDGKYRQLEYNRYIKMQNDVESVVEDKTYIGQLTYYLSDCPDISGKLETVFFDKSSIINLFKYYYKNTDSEVAFQRKVEKTNRDYWVSAGLLNTSLSFYGDDHELVTSEYTTSTNFIGAFAVEFVLPRNNRKWSFYNELSRSKFKIEGDYYAKTITRNNTGKINLEYAVWRLTSMARFTYPFDKLSVFVNGGLSVAMDNEKVNTLSIRRTTASGTTVEEGTAIQSNGSNEIGLAAGMGIKIKRFSFELRYDGARGLCKTKMTSSLTEKLSVTTGFRIGK